MKLLNSLENFVVSSKWTIALITTDVSFHYW